MNGIKYEYNDKIFHMYATQRDFIPRNEQINWWFGKKTSTFIFAMRLLAYDCGVSDWIIHDC